MRAPSLLLGAIAAACLTLLAINPLPAQVPQGTPGITRTQGDARYARLGAANTLTAANTVSGALTASGQVVFGVQSFALNGATQTATLSGGAIVKVTGSTTSSQVNLPSAVTAGAGTPFFIDDEATVAFTIGATAGNIDGASTKTVSAGPVAYVSNGTNWLSVGGMNQYLGDARWGQLGAANTWTTANTFNAQLALVGQTFSATGTISGANGTVVTYTGSTASQTISLPSTPTTNRICLFRNEATVAVTLSGNGSNVDSSASVTVPVNGCGLIWYDGAAWWSMGPSSWLANTWQANATFSGTVGVSGTLTASSSLTASAAFGLNGRWQVASQTTSASSYTVLSASGSATCVETTASSTGTSTLTMPSTIQGNQIYVLYDAGGNAGTNNITVSGNGHNINGASSITLTKNYASVWIKTNNAASAMFVVAACNYP